MSQALLDDLYNLMRARQWSGILERESEFLTIAEPALSRARALHILSQARWNRGRDPFDYAQAVRFAREAVSLNPQGGKALHWLGTCLVTLGRYKEGRRVLQQWMARYSEWPESVQVGLGDVQYALGYAARYEHDLVQAEMWYQAALTTFATQGDDRASRTRCALAQVRARLRRTDTAEQILGDGVAPAFRPYELGAWAVVHAMAGRNDLAVATADAALGLFADLEDSDPWEWAELHLLVAQLGQQMGDLALRNMHLELASETLAASPRNDLYTAARLLLDNERREVC